jgi:hypothetical protein
MFLVLGVLTEVHVRTPICHPRPIHSPIFRAPTIVIPKYYESYAAPLCPCTLDGHRANLFIMPRSGSVFCQRRRSTNVHTCYRHLTECNLTYPAFSSCLAQKLSPILCDLRHRFYKASGGSLNKARARHALLLLGCLHFATVLLIQIKRQELIQFRPLHMYKLMIRERGQSKWRHFPTVACFFC